MRERFSARGLAALLATVLVAGCPGPAELPRASGAASQRPSGSLEASVLAGLDAHYGLTPRSEAATRGSVEVTLADVDAGNDAAARRFAHDVLSSRTNALIDVIDEMLADAEAKKRGLTGAKALIQQVQATVKAPTDAEARAFFQRRLWWMPKRYGQSYELLAPAIKHRLELQARIQSVYDVLLRRQLEEKVTVSLPRIRNHFAPKGPTLGPKNAPVTVVVVSPLDADAGPTLVDTDLADRVHAIFGKHVRVVYDPIPVDDVKAADLRLAEAGACAHAQGRFWAFYRAFQENSAGDGLEKLAGSVPGMDAAKFHQCLFGRELRARVKGEIAAAKAAGIGATPAVFVDGIRLRFRWPAWPFDLESLVDVELGRSPLVPGPLGHEPASALDGLDAYLGLTPKTVVATVGGKAIHLADIQDDELQRELAAAEGKLRRATHEIRSNALFDLFNGAPIGGLEKFLRPGDKGPWKNLYAAAMRKARARLFDLDGAPAKGPKDAPVVIVEFSDFQCPFCKRVLKTVDRIVKDYGKDVRLVHRDYPLPFHVHAEKAAEAGACANAQGRFWPYHDVLFAHQDELDVAGLKKLASGIAGLDMSRFDACLDGGEMKAPIAAEIAAGRAAGVDGTPTFFINGHVVSGAQDFSMFRSAINQALAKRFVAVPEQAQKDTADEEAHGDAPAVHPSKRVKVAATGPSKGPKDAPVTIVEFSDFQCPFCKRAEGTIHQILAAYGGKVRFVHRYFPLPFHLHAERAAEAAACAGAQGQFWPYHDALFAHQTQLDVPDLKKMARGIQGLDGAKFDACVNGRRTKAKVQADVAAGKAAGVRGTPTFFVDGIEVLGAQPFSSFKAVIDRELAQAKGGAAAKGH